MIPEKRLIFIPKQLVEFRVQLAQIGAYSVDHGALRHLLLVSVRA